MFSLALGIGTKNAAGQWLEVYYPRPLLNPAQALVQALDSVLGSGTGNRCLEPDQAQLQALGQACAAIDTEFAELCATLANSVKPVVLTLLESDTAPAFVPEVYLKLHLLSHRLVRPHGLDLDGMFGLLPNVAWTSAGAVALAELPAAQLKARLAGQTLEVTSVDKFPRMTDYVVPSGVRIADTARVRLGAYLGEGTTIMHEGFVNFNAGTEGPAMIEGRISAGVFVGASSDLGGGCSILGTLSGGNKTVISVGKNCLIGANAGLGIPLGDRCTIEAGLYLTAGTKVSMLDKDGKEVRVCKALALAGVHDLLFRRNSQSGRVECLTNKSEIELNTELHSHN
ncbi:MAG TPA: 2,3,4,5-tetrahydropyridine-2,6-dicarboxylate N-succinyltransferase [Hyphomicrobiales bacterium]|nr:2,3,4,5-tetrahydropyridine-2,6-dicarboxylate N-succinyltransferase [Hyphomicrobiales bacterium]